MVSMSAQERVVNAPGLNVPGPGAPGLNALIEEVTAVNTDLKEMSVRLQPNAKIVWIRGLCDSIIIYILQCIMYSLHCSVHCTLYIMQYTL